MKVIIAGSRSIKDPAIVYRAIEESGFTITEVISGTAQGVDRLGEAWAMGQNIPIRRFPADWHLHGKAAGYIRNQEMAENADALIAIWDGESKGTKHMIDIARGKGLKVYAYDTLRQQPFPDHYSRSLAGDVQDIPTDGKTPPKPKEPTP